MKQQITCKHPYLRPTQWNQQRPEDYIGYTCDCGENFTCPVCGHGYSLFPCECHKKMIARHSFDNISQMINDSSAWDEYDRLRNSEHDNHHMLNS